MDINIIKTIQWSDSKETLLSLAEKCLGKPPIGKLNDFVEFISAYQTVNRKQMTTFLDNVIRRNALNDVTKLAVISEDSCLFSYETDYPTALDIVFSGLRILNTGGVLPSLWCFLDCNKTAVVHFVNKSGWYAEVFFQCNEDFSVLHLVQDGFDTHVVPVIFTTDFAKLAELPLQQEEHCLRQYLPRDLYSFLSKKGGKKKAIAPQKSKKTLPNDNFDLL